MEILVIALVLGGVLKYGVTDLVHAAKGTPNPRYEAAKARSAARTARVEARTGRKPGRLRSKGPGPFACYLSTLWADAWTDATARHMVKRAKRVKPESGGTGDAAGRPERPRGAARVFLDGLTGDARRGARRRWEQAWTRADERRRTHATRVRPDTVVVPGEVVDPVPPTEPADTPETPSGPEANPSSASGSDGPTTPDAAVREDPVVCVICDGSRTWDGRPCPACARPSPQQYDPADLRPAHDFDGLNPVRRIHLIREDNAMPDQHDSNGNTAIPATRKVIDMSTLNTTDLSNLDQADAEISQAREAFLVLIEAQNEALSWAQNLPDRWAGTDFDTRELQGSIAGVAESVQHGVNADSLEALANVEAAIKQARTIGEVADEHDATGDVGKFRAS